MMEFSSLQLALALLPMLRKKKKPQCYIPHSYLKQITHVFLFYWPASLAARLRCTGSAMDLSRSYGCPFQVKAGKSQGAPSSPPPSLPLPQQQAGLAVTVEPGWKRPAALSFRTDTAIECHPPQQALREPQGQLCWG